MSKDKTSVMVKSPLHQSMMELDWEERKAIASIYIISSKDWMKRSELLKLLEFLKDSNGDDGVAQDLIENLILWDDIPIEGFKCKLLDHGSNRSSDNSIHSNSTNHENLKMQLEEERATALEELKWLILLYILNFSILERKKYDSRMRTTLFKLGKILDLDPLDLSEKEFKLGIQLQQAMKEMKEKSNQSITSRVMQHFGKGDPKESTVEETTDDNFLHGTNEIKNLKKLKSSTVSSGRLWKLGGISLIGGGLIALAGGITAPIIIPALIGVLGLVASGGAILGIGAGVAVITSAVASILTVGGIPLIAGIFGATGGGLAAYMADYRFSGISHFKFTKIVSFEQASILVAIEDKIREEQEKLKQKLEEKKLQNKQMKKNQSTIHQHTSDIYAPTSTIAPNEVSERKMSHSDIIELKRIQNERVHEKMKNHHGMNVFISITGCLNYHATSFKIGAKEFSQKWLDICVEVPFAEHYVLEWEPKILSSLGHAIRDFVVSAAGKEIFKLWLGAVSTTFSAAFSAVMGPLFALSIFKAINNPWSIAMDRAKKAAIILAQVLKDRVHGNRPVSLVGLGIGAQVIFRALEILAENGDDAMGIVENVYLIGAAVNSSSETKWSKVRSIVSGRLVNAYCRKDWILGILYRGLEVSIAVAGLAPIQHSNIENICLDHICNGYSSYENPKTFKKVLRYLKLNEGISSTSLITEPVSQEDIYNICDEDGIDIERREIEEAISKYKEAENIQENDRT